MSTPISYAQTIGPMERQAILDALYREKARLEDEMSKPDGNTQPRQYRLSLATRAIDLIQTATPIFSQPEPRRK